MGELLLMASNGCPPGSGLGVLFHPQQGLSMPPKDLNHIIHNQRSSPHSLDLGLQLKEGLWSSNGSLIMRPLLAGAEGQEGTPLERLIFGFEIAKNCIRHQSILKLLASGLMGKGNECGLRDLASNFGRHQPLTDLPLQPLPDTYSSWYFTNAESKWQSLAYPSSMELYFNDAQLIYNGNGTGVLSAIPELHLPKNNQTMLVPYFERRRRPQSKTESPKINIEQAKSQQKVIQKKKIASARTSYIHACETLLSVMIVDRNHQARSAVLSLKKSGTQLPQFLTQLSGTIAGTGIAVVISVVYGVMCRRLPFSGNKLWSSGLGLGLVWLSWAVSKLRDTVMAISRAPGGEEKMMMEYLDRSLRNIYFGVAALVAVAFLGLT